jgi:co-chaperonin GroES (HSP10)
MMPKLFKTSLAVYTQAEWSGKNDSGWTAFADHVIILPDHLASKSAGGVDIPDDVVDRMTMAAEAGVVVSVGEEAFKGLTVAPKPGDRVSIGRYSGQLLMGSDTKTYRIMSASEIGAIYAQ